MKYLNIYLVAIIISCGGSSQKQRDTASEENTVTGEQSCLADITDPAKWYPLSAVSTLVNQPEEKIKQQASEQYKSCQYNWKTERTHVMKAGNVEMEVPTNNTIAITIRNLDEDIEKANRMHKREFTYDEYFDSYHTLATKEEMEEINKSLDKKAEEDKDANAKLAKGLLAQAKTENFSHLDDLGDKANQYVQTAPGLRETRLSVLYGNVVLLVSVDISDEDADDLTAATTVAEAVIGLCD
jgi:hypothetical protein